MTTLENERKPQRSERTINTRISDEELDFIDAAANVSNQTRSSFILEAARRRAEEVFLDRRVFPLNEEQWEAFNEALDAPPAYNEQLANLLTKKSPWE